MKKLLIVPIFLMLITFVGCSTNNTVSMPDSNEMIVIEPNDIIASNLNGYKDLTSKPSEENLNGNNSSIKPENAQYIGNKNSKKFHISNCSYVKKMKSENAIYFDTSNDARSQGYSPCAKCNP